MICKTCGMQYELDARAFNPAYCSYQCMRRGTAPAPEVERLDVECPRHGPVRPVCPKCAGAKGGKAHQGVPWGTSATRRAVGLPLRRRRSR